MIARLLSIVVAYRDLSYSGGQAGTFEFHPTAMGALTNLQSL